ncbi:MAG TPA: glycosyltransferase family 2 protein [Lachnospiraceae bacterium]|nr:glycosyltransferase family 2 protein [Lachnospiraceae bacterium]
MNEDMVSVIIPVYNAAKCISDTVQSVRSQTYTNWELILVDDGSTDRSVEIMQEFANDDIRLIRTDGGKSAALARNRGIMEAKGRYLAFLDADDLWNPDKLEQQVAFMKREAVAFSFTGYEFADEEGVGVQKIVKVPAKLKYGAALKNTTIFTSTVMFDLKKISREAVMMPNVASEDTATWWKILKNGYTAYGLNESLTLYRRGSGTLSSNKVIAVKRIWNLYRNVEHLSVPKSCYCFCFYAVRAVIRRM